MVRSRDDTEVLAELEELERLGWGALTGEDGAAFFDWVMTPDGVNIKRFGVSSRAEVLDGFANEEPWVSFTISDTRLLRLHEDVAMLTYRLRARRESGQILAGVFTSTYVRLDGRWRLHVHQQSLEG